MYHLNFSTLSLRETEESLSRFLKPLCEKNVTELLLSTVFSSLDSKLFPSLSTLRFTKDCFHSTEPYLFTSHISSLRILTGGHLVLSTDSGDEVSEMEEILNRIEWYFPNLIEASLTCHVYLDRDSTFDPTSSEVQDLLLRYPFLRLSWDIHRE